MTELVNDTGDWLVQIGIHRGTITSRDSETIHRGSEAAARAAYADAKRYYTRTGVSIWYAKMIAPGAPYATGWVMLDHGTPYRS